MDRSTTRRVVSLAVLTCALLAPLSAADEVRYPPFLSTDAHKEAWRIGWPRWHGPHGNGTAIDCGLDLVTTFADMRLVWESEAVIPGWTPGNNYDVRTGFCTPVMANGRVYVYYPWPHGFPKDRPHPDSLDKPAFKQARQAINKRSDDVVICVDALTGKTVWKRVMVERSPTLFGSGKEGGHFTMCVDQGRAYAFGGGNWIYCLDAVTGETIWEQDDQTGCTGPANATALVADGVLLYHDAGHLFGYDAATGKRLWDIGGLITGARGSATAKLWRVDGRELVLYEATCIDPRRGKVLWSIDIDRSSGNQCAAHGEYLVCYGDSENEAPRGFRISPTGYEKLWQLDGKRYEPKPYSSPCFYKGHAIMGLRAPRKLPGQDKRLWYFTAVDLESGAVQEIEGMYKDWKYQPIIAEGHYYYFAGRNFAVVDPDPESLRILDHVMIKHHQADDNAWKQDASPAYACGLMYIRTVDRLRCYDLRRR